MQFLLGGEGGAGRPIKGHGHLDRFNIPTQVGGNYRLV